MAIHMYLSTKFVDATEYESSLDTEVCVWLDGTNDDGIVVETKVGNVEISFHDNKLRVQVWHPGDIGNDPTLIIVPNQL